MIKKLLIILMFLGSLSAHAQDNTILVLADSLSASYGIAIEDGWVSLLQNRLREQGYTYNVFNASISGDTTHGAKSRLDEILNDRKPDITILELGGNDGLRGLPIPEIKSNLGEIINLLETGGSKVLLVPMLLPPNYGKFYIDRFTAIYTELAEETDTKLSKFILDGIAENPELMQNDGIHPTAEAQIMMLDNIWPDLESMFNEE
ncbi:MAG: arylesterase [Gammaproteobacteria bacterium]|nr:arylesterase [Gammaproteobacteria bacterium]